MDIIYEYYFLIIKLFGPNEDIIGADAFNFN